MDESPALETTALTKVYGSGHTEVVALRDASMRVGRGEIVALLGPSGAGKSTFLLCVGLINPPTRGRVTIGGRLMQDGPRSLGDLRHFRRENIGFVFQKSNLIPFLSAVENVQIVGELIGRPSSVARRRAMELLDTLGVGPRALNMPTQLSGGEQQRVTIARSLANQPSLILADEPTAALDSVRGRQVMELFRDVAHKYGTGVIVVTHDHRALDVFDTVYEMEDGALRAASHAVANASMEAR
ncbi:MAG: Macrolide export ATP-binding/permease protein MacB [Myxococcota bacterium]|nr:Macrolide export ATP-binding/permease protein MacB [Myxococcota bacterium]